MAGSISPTDTRPVFVQNPRLSDDSEQEKARGVATPSNPLGVRDVAGASGGVTVHKSK
jgi:hypothetical protein